MTGQARIKWATGALDCQANGHRAVGEVKRQAEVTTLDLAAPIPSPTVTACTDISMLKVVNAADGTDVPLPSQLPRYVQTAAAAFQEGRWTITDFVNERNRPC
ncbi:hypothetical protein OG216_47395 (plasmid) [Streptomycetaceae bacterium NBC_01309]